MKNIKISRNSPPMRKVRGREARIRELNLYHDDRLAALGTLAAGIAHELNQPLNTIRVVTDGFLFGRTEGWPLDPEELFEGLEMISKQVARMDRVIRNVRNFAREERDAGGESVMANEAVENVFSMIGRQIEAHGIHVEKDLEPELPPLRASPNELEQVVMNLIVNARQALDGGSGDAKTLRVRTGSRDGAVSIEVSDNGGGIPDRLLGKIFDPFFTTKAAGKGTGLGLSICQSIVSKLGGRIEVYNNDIGGATFIVLVPAGGERP
jgi:C4-dicarboxylate-specific signal transduction histidine kinase